MECNIAELIVMTRYFPLLETRIVLRTMIFGAGMLAVLVLACAGTAAGATFEFVTGASHGTGAWRSRE